MQYCFMIETIQQQKLSYRGDSARRRSLRRSRSFKVTDVISLLVNNIIIIHMLPKTRVFGYIFIADTVWV